MSDHKPGNMDSEKKEFIREKMLEPKKGKRHYLGIVCLIAVCVILFGVATGASLAFVLGHMGVRIQDNGEESMSVSWEQDWMETTESEEESPHESQTAELGMESTNIGESQESTEKSFEEQVEEIVQSMEPDGTLAEKVNDSVYNGYEIAKHSLVTVYVNGQATEVGSTMKPQETAFGVIVAMSDYEAVVLTDITSLKSTENITVAVGEHEVDAAFKEQDSLTGLVSLAISLRKLPDTVRRDLCAISLGNSYDVKLGDRVLLAGSPLGVADSILQTNITYIDKEAYVTDGIHRVLYTDAAAVSGGTGVMLDMEGQMIGWITTWCRSSQLAQFTSAIGISELKYVMEDLILGEGTGVLGVTVHNVTEQIATEFSLPAGLYVTAVDNQAPAYQAGIQNGDIITAINGTELRTVRGLQSLLSDMLPGEQITVTVMRLSRDSYKEVKFQIELGSR